MLQNCLYGVFLLATKLLSEVFFPQLGKKKVKKKLTNPT